MKKLNTLILSLCFYQFAFCQIGVIKSPPLIADTLINRLVGEGIVSFSNPNLICGDDGSGYFFGADVASNFGMNSGILLTSGVTSAALSPNTSGSATGQGGPGYALLEEFPNAYNGTFNACVLEFDFVPSNTEVSLNYIFGSEEYPEYVGSQFNDIMAIIIEGGSEYPSDLSVVERNIAIIPGSLNVNVELNFLNFGSYSQFYIDNTDPMGPSHAYIQYDGFTTVLTAKASVTPCETYHIAIAVADVSDTDWDSGIFLEEDSFQSIGEEYSVEVLTSSPQLCGDMTSINLAVQPIDGVTFEWQPAEYVIMDSEDGSIVTASPPEGSENFTYTVTAITPFDCISVPPQSIEVSNSQELEITVDAPKVLCVDLNEQIPPFRINAFGASSYTWSPIGGSLIANPGDDKALFVPNPANNDVEYTVTGTDISGNCVGQTTFMIEVVQGLLVIVELSSVNGAIGELSSTVIGGSGEFEYQWTPFKGLGNPDSSKTFIQFPTNLVNYTVRVTDLVTGCENKGSFALSADLVSIEDTPIFSKIKPFQLYPTFTQSKLHLDYVLQKNTSISINLFDLSGQKIAILLKKNQTFGNHQETIDLTKWSLTAGVYILELQLEGEMYREKIVVF